MNKLDLKKEFKKFYNPSSVECEMVKLPGFKYLMIDGEGDPNNSIEFQNAVEALYSLAYTIKFTLKNNNTADFSVMPLEGLWSCKSSKSFDINNKRDWQWTLMIMMPDYITSAEIDNAVISIKSKKEVIAIDKVRLDNLEESDCVQIMHIGPYSEEEPTVIKLHQFMFENNLTDNGRHHEIYLGDPRRCAPAKLRTILRQPVKKI